MMRGAVPVASEVTFPKSELVNTATGLFGVATLKTLKTSHRNCSCWLPTLKDRDNAVSTFHLPGPRMASIGMVPYVPVAGWANAFGFSHCEKLRFGMNGSSSTWFTRCTATGWPVSAMS